MIGFYKDRIIYHLIDKTLKCLMPQRRAIFRKNFDIVFSLKTIEEKRIIQYQFFKHILLFIKEFLFWPYYIKKTKVTVEGSKHIEAALLKKKGIIILCPHLGNWELALPITISKLTQIKADWYCIRKPFKPWWFDKLVVNRFSSRRITILKSKGAFRKTIKAIKYNNIVLFTYDQKTSNIHGINLPFFGKSCYTYSSLAELSLKYSPEVIPGYSYRQDKNHHKVVLLPAIKHHPKSTIKERTVLYNKKLEEVILKHPEQWFCWLHDRWGLKKKRQIKKKTI